MSLNFSYLAQDIMNTSVTKKYVDSLSQKFILDNLNKEQRLTFYELSSSQNEEAIMTFLQNNIVDFEENLEQYIATNFLELLNNAK